MDGERKECKKPGSKVFLGTEKKAEKGVLFLTGPVAISCEEDTDQQQSHITQQQYEEPVEIVSSPDFQIKGTTQTAEFKIDLDR
ncbi:hypothetical protein STEG23_016151, partial [Scotinomys teguina]